MKKYFIWWIPRANDPNGGEWYGWKYLTDYETFQEQLSIRTNNADVQNLYRWVWDGSEWQYDTRPDSELIKSSVQFAWL